MDNNDNSSCNDDLDDLDDFDEMGKIGFQRFCNAFFCLDLKLSTVE